MSRAPFVWSWSRRGTYERCKRRYWYEYYGSRNGWRNTASPLARQLYLLKRLQSRPQWVGILVHEAAEQMLIAAREGRGLDPRVLAAETRTTAEQSLAEAKQGLYKDNPRKHIGFTELHYAEDPGEQVWEETLQDIHDQVLAAHEHRLMQRLLDVPSQIIEVEALERLHLDDVALWVSLDVLVRSHDGGFVIIDWKTGRHHDPDTVARQIAVYGLYVQKRYGAHPDQIQGASAYTRTGTFSFVGMDPDLARTTVADVQRSIEEMASYLPDPMKNVAPEQLFEKRPEGHAHCAQCPFRGPCWSTSDNRRPLDLFSSG